MSGVPDLAPLPEPPESGVLDEPIVEAPVVVEETPGGANWLIGGLAAASTRQVDYDAEISGTVHASRAFAPPKTYKAGQFAGYGLIHFPNSYSSAEAQRFEMFCHAFRILRPVEELETPPDPIPRSEQMVTVWPIRDQAVSSAIKTARQEESAAALRGDRAARDAAGNKLCAVASAGYRLDLDVAGARIETNGEALSSDGPYLVAWAPGGDKGKPGRTALLVDLGPITTPEGARREMGKWRDAIERRRGDWGRTDEAGLRDLIRDWANRAGPTILSLVGLG
ncbi:MAG: hypothetical protein CML68_13870 [Rhodobacteraceae bacterium]|nr:hypothetical protein [Paracoccaceae bacterium]